jgi:ABC-type sugar transport system substrate-binding protein
MRLNQYFAKFVFAFLAAASLLMATPAAMAADALKPRKIGLLVITMQSESLARWASNLQVAAEKLKWSVVLKDGENNPAVVATRLPELLAQGVDAVITLAIDAPLMTEGLKMAREKKVPVIAVAIGVNPAGKELFTGSYAPDDYALGVVLANYLLKKTPKPTAVAQTATVVYAADRMIVAVKDTIEKGGGTIAKVTDVDVTNLVNSFTQTTTDLALAHPKATAFFSCCDFSPLINLPALKAANRADMLLLTRYDNDSSLKAIRAGAPLAVVTNNTDAYNFAALDALAAFFAKGTPIPPTATGIKDSTQVIDKSNVPADGYVYPYEKELQVYVDRWSKAYTF